MAGLSKNCSRVTPNKKDLSEPSNARPDYQELLTDIRFIIWVAPVTNVERLTLSERLQAAFAHPEAIDCFGGLCLGESRDLVNAVNLLPEAYQGEPLRWLLQDIDGSLTLPYWVDHVGSRGTRWRRYKLLPESSAQWQPPESAWTEIQAT